MFSYKKIRDQFTFTFTRTLFYYMDEIVMERCLFDLKRLERGATGVLGARSGVKNTDGARSDGGVWSAGAVF